MTIPPWFDPDYYMADKLAQLQAESPSWTAAAMWQAVEGSRLTPYEHYVAYGDGERINPNALFDERDYLRNKALQCGMTESTVYDAIRAAGMTTAEHYDRYGFREGVNPSDSFSQSKYLQAKLYQEQAVNPAYGITDLINALNAAELTPVEHYLLCAEQEGLTEADANALGYSYATDDARPVVNPNKPGGFAYTLDHSSNTVHSVTIERVVVEAEENGVPYYSLAQTTVDLTEVTEVTQVTITGSATMDLSDALAMLGA